MLAIYLVAIAVFIGLIASRQNWRLALLYVPVALLGALLGALIAFGDAPFLLRYRMLNPITLAFMGSIALVSCARFWRHRYTKSS